MPLDSNLPTYYFKPPNDKHRSFDSTLLFTQFDSDPEPRYILRYTDPASPQSKNCYAAGLFDAYIPDVVFGEILIKPEWTQPTLSQEEIRKNGGVPPPPAPIIPKEVTVQLYAPDQQIVVQEQPGSWNNAPTYHFHMPQQTFRLPSASSLDYSADDPAADPSTPQINFLWKRDGRKDLKCFVTGKSTDNGKKKKGGKEPPIIVAIFQDFKDLTIYEPNLHRVEMEDFKGLEVVLLLSATVVRDIWCGQKKDCFNSGEAPRKNSAGGGLLNRKASIPLLNLGGSTSNLPSTAQVQSNGLPTKAKRRQSIPPVQPLGPPGVPPPDPRQQWEIDAETARLQKLYNSERQAEDARRRERERRDEEEAKRIKKMLEQEEKEQRKQQAAIDKESARLMRVYGNQSNLVPPKPPQPQRQSFPSWGHNQAAAPPPQPPRPQPQPPGPYGNGPYQQHPASTRPPAASQSSYFHGGGNPGPPQRPQHAAASSVNLASGANPHAHTPRPTSAAPPELRPKKSSVWGFLSGDPTPRLKNQRSTMF